MDSNEADQEATRIQERAGGLAGASSGAAGDDVSSELLLDLEGEWEEQQLRRENRQPALLHIDDPAVIETLQKRIDQRKRLYAFLGISSYRFGEPAIAELASPVVQPEQEPSVLEEPSIAAIPGPPEGAQQPAALELPHSPLFGRYEILEIAGSGGFGVVYKARDLGLDRFVAIKMPKPEAARHFDPLAYQQEARLLAGLSHPNIVPIYDVGHADDGRCYTVSRYIDGGNLAIELKKNRPGFSRSAELVAILCDALYYAHTRDVFHRDIKPANILLDSTGVPYLADFGLALKDEDFGTGPHHLGTPAFMSPEQARGEGHFVDGRSDIFSLGVVFYMMLSGRRPFRGATRHQVLHQIVNSEPRPPRQIDSDTPKELERICLKAIAKRANERYLVARDMADDLREYLSSANAAHRSPDRSQTVHSTVTAESSEAAPAPRPESSESTPQAMKIVPKGLCSFDEHDADFFLELLPGPRDRYGLPESLRFWKTRILATDPDKTFRVGLLYGPSGCGKSSLLKAGLLPQLKGSPVKWVYVEATANDTEARLSRSLRHEVPGLPPEAGLARLVALLRQNRSPSPAAKVLLILDQFEQWLFAHGHGQERELVTALRQCDGVRVQALCLVRDDFWMAATRFMRDLDIELVPNENVAAVDLFDTKHARKVLSAYGRAYETLPSGQREPAGDRKGFLDNAISGLAQDGRIVPVRLALFAEMVKNRPWTRATLAEVGGMEGVGAKFLDDSFDSPRSNPVHRVHAIAAKAVLESLLPETNADLKGRMRSLAELRDVSGYSSRPADFTELMQVLDRNLRLVTPVDVERSIDDDMPSASTREPYYQLTHDYLVHSVRDWLNKGKLATRRGRAELLLADRAGFWNSKPVNRHLPSMREWATIGFWSSRKKWTEPQQRMMKRAGRVHGFRLFVGIAALCLLSIEVVAYNDYSTTDGLLDSLSTANVEKIPDILDRLSIYPRWFYARRLKTLSARPRNDPRAQLAYSLAQLPDESQIQYLYERLLKADPAEMALIRDRLESLREKLSDGLWNDLQAAGPTDACILPVAGVFALRAGELKVGTGCRKGCQSILGCKRDDARAWREAMLPIRAVLTGPLEKIYLAKGRPEFARELASELLAAYAPDRPGLLVNLLLEADPKSFATLFPVLRKDDTIVMGELRKAIKEAPARPAKQIEPEATEKAKDDHAARCARAAVAMVRFGYGSEVWHLLEYQPDPRWRSAFVSALSTLGVDPSVLVDELASVDKSEVPEPAPAGLTAQKNGYLFDPITSKRRALLLAIAGCPAESLTPTKRDDLIAQFLVLYENDPDAGVHSAAELALKRLGHSPRSSDEATRPPQKSAASPRRWYVNPEGQTLVLIDGPVVFDMGAPLSDPERGEEEVRHRREIPGRYYMLSKEVTVAEFQKYSQAKFGRPHAYIARYTGDRGPQIGVTWFAAAAYCNWLSAKEGLPACYKPTKDDKFAEGMTVDSGAVKRGGYRLPTEAEWEYACRAGTHTSRHFGHSLELLGAYEWYITTGGFVAHPCGELLPNELGLFDMMGNVSEWCHDRLVDYPKDLDVNAVTTDAIRDETVSLAYRHIRGGSWRMDPAVLRSTTRIWMSPTGDQSNIGFRPARSCP